MKKFNSFADLGKYMGVNREKKSSADTKKCRACGGSMTRVPGTNVYTCNGVDGKPCNRFALAATAR